MVVFKAGMVQWDDDLVHNAENTMETLVRMGEQIGRRRTEEERREYLANAPKTGRKNETITKLFSHFPLIGSAK